MYCIVWLLLASSICSAQRCRIPFQNSIAFRLRCMFTFSNQRKQRFRPASSLQVLYTEPGRGGMTPPPFALDVDEFYLRHAHRKCAAGVAGGRLPELIRGRLPPLFGLASEAAAIRPTAVAPTVSHAVLGRTCRRSGGGTELIPNHWVWGCEGMWTPVPASIT